MSRASLSSWYCATTSPCTLIARRRCRWQRRHLRPQRLRYVVVAAMRPARAQEAEDEVAAAKAEAAAEVAEATEGAEAEAEAEAEAAAEAEAEEPAPLSASQSHSKSTGERRWRECFTLASYIASAAVRHSTPTMASAFTAIW